MAKSTGIMIGLGAAAAAVGLLLWSRSSAAATSGESAPIVPPNPEPGLDPDPNYPAGLGDQVSYIAMIGSIAYNKGLGAVQAPSNPQARAAVLEAAKLFSAAATRFEVRTLKGLPPACAGVAKNAIMASKNAYAVAGQSAGTPASATLPTDAVNALAAALNLWQAVGKAVMGNCAA